MLQNVTQIAINQSAEILKIIYPDEFSIEQYDKLINDILDRFSSRVLGDTIFWVGCEFCRTLITDDRFMIPILAGLRMGKDYSLILE